MIKEEGRIGWVGGLYSGGLLGGGEERKPRVVVHELSFVEIVLCFLEISLHTHLVAGKVIKSTLLDDMVVVSLGGGVIK